VYFVYFVVKKAFFRLIILDTQIIKS